MFYTTLLDIQILRTDLCRQAQTVADKCLAERPKQTSTDRLSVLTDPHTQTSAHASVLLSLCMTVEQYM